MGSVVGSGEGSLGKSKTVLTCSFGQYIYIGSNIHLYTSYVVQCITLHLVSTTISRHVNTLAQRTPANPRGTNIGLGALVSLCYWLGTLVTILGFIATVCIEIFYCRGSSWHSLDDDPAKCPPWWSKLPLNSVAAIQFSAMALLIIAGGVVVLKVPRRGERVPGVTVGGVLMIIATALVAVRLALIGTRVRSPMDDGWERIGSLRLVEAVEVIVYLAAMFCVDLTKTGWKKKSQPEQLQMWTQYPPQPPPGYAYQVPPDGPPVYQMPPPAR